MSKATPEGKVKQAVKKLLAERGAYYFSPMTHGYGASGIPDIVACYEGVFVAIECKAGSNKPTPLQVQHIEAILKAGGIALVINERSISMLSAALDTIKEKLND